MTLQGLGLAILLLLAPLMLAWRQKNPDPKNQGGAKEAGGCKAPSDWDPKLQFTPNHSSYALNDLVQLSCAGEEYVPSVPQIRCISNGTQALWNGTATCNETCQRPVWWDPRLQMAPVSGNYRKNEEVTLRCSNGFHPSFTHIKCAAGAQTSKYSGSLSRDIWLGKKSSDAWIRIEGNIVCIETCQRPRWGPGIQLAPDQDSYRKNEEVILNCPEGFQPSFTHVKCTGKVLSISNGKPVYREAWNGRDSRGRWITIQSMFSVDCFEKCQKPQWDPWFIFDQEQMTFNPNDVLEVRCPEGHWPPPMEIKCMKLNPREVPHSGWLVRNDTGLWHRMERNLTCVEVLQVVSETLEISSTSIKLNWTCRLADVCEHIRARCRLEEPSSASCKAEEVKGEERLSGQKGTFSCPHLQPFTVYSVTISLPPRTILYTRLLRTKETVPDKLEKLWLDPTTGLLRWKALPSCKGEIIGYQLNITARRMHDGSFLEFKQVLVNQSVTQYMPLHQTSGSKYTVTVQGLTVAGAGAASLLEFQTYISVAGQPLGMWPGSAIMVVVVVLVLVPISAGILWFVLSRKRKKDLPHKAEEDHYTELQPYENLDDYCVIKETLLAGEAAGKGGQAGEPLPRPLPVLESSGDGQSSEGENVGQMSKAQ